MKNSDLSSYFGKISETLQHVDSDAITGLVKLLLKARVEERMIFIFGNGGSAATASHVAGDFMKGISYGLDKGFRVICLNDNVSGMLAISNDLTYEDIFIEQLKVFLKKDDVVIGISGSGNSANIVRAIEYANSKEAVTVAFCGYKGGKVKDLAKHIIHVPIQDMEITEDIHIIIFHAIKQMMMKELKGEGSSMGKTYDERVK